MLNHQFHKRGITTKIQPKKVTNSNKCELISHASLPNDKSFHLIVYEKIVPFPKLGNRETIVFKE